ncbi:hypothetical protein D3C87_2022020 [compost metagenome]
MRLLDAEQHLVLLHKAPDLRGIVTGKHAMHRMARAHGIDDDVNRLGQDIALARHLDEVSLSHLLEMTLNGDQALELL